MIALLAALAVAPFSVAPSDEVVAGEMVVDLADDASEADVTALAARLHLTLRPNSPRSFELGRLDLAEVPDGETEDEALAALRAEPLVEHAEPLAILRASFVPNDPLYAEKQWHLARVGAERAWEFGCGRGVTVAVIDTGVACYDQGPFSRGTDLQGTRCVPGFDFVHDREDAPDDHGHGTHVAGTIAQTTDNGRGAAGLSFCARLMPVKVLTKDGWGTLADVAEGIRFAADHGAQVINLSLGGPSPSGILEDAVKHARSRGTLIVAAAGNSGGPVGYPAAYPDALAVSATDESDALAWFSSRGPSVGLAAPGVGITQQTVCDGGENHCELFGTFSGTSMASPHVAGAAALLFGLGATTDQVHDTLLASARAPAGSTPTEVGAGIVDAGAAASSFYGRRLVVRLVALAALTLALAFFGKRRRSTSGQPPASLGTFAAALFAGPGLLGWAPYASLSRQAGPLRPVLELLERPFGDWPLALTPSYRTAFTLLAGLSPLAAAALFYGVRRLRPLLGGFALGTAAYEAPLLVYGAGISAFAPLGSVGVRLAAFAVAGTCMWVARVALGGAETAGRSPPRPPSASP